MTNSFWREERLLLTRKDLKGIETHAQLDDRYVQRAVLAKKVTSYSKPMTVPIWDWSERLSE